MLQNSRTQNSPCRFKIYFQDDTIRQRSQDNVQLLLASAVDESDVLAAKSNVTLMARKALKYRKVYDRMTGVNVNSPAFDAGKFMGVAWCHMPSLKAHCAGRCQ